MRASIVDKPTTTQGQRHAPTTITLHWLTAVLVVLLWTIGQTIDYRAARATPRRLPFAAYDTRGHARAGD